jgi:hypothetical protein
MTTIPSMADGKRYLSSECDFLSLKAILQTNNTQFSEPPGFVMLTSRSDGKSQIASFILIHLGKETRSGSSQQQKAIPYIKHEQHMSASDKLPRFLQAILFTTKSPFCAQCMKLGRSDGKGGYWKYDTKTEKIGKLENIIRN